MVTVSLLRAVNLADRNCVRREALRGVYESLGLEGVRSHVQSGNVVFRTAARDLTRVGRDIEGAIERAFGFRPAVILRSLPEWRETVRANPFESRAETDPAKLAVLFLADRAGAAALARLRQLQIAPEELVACPREIYIYYPNGMGRSKLTGALLERTLGTRATARNWNTVTRLLAMAEGMEE
jgi:uncharacterized protein (DUF1697 family)